MAAARTAALGSEGVLTECDQDLDVYLTRAGKYQAELDAVAADAATSAALARHVSDAARAQGLVAGCALRSRRARTARAVTMQYEDTDAAASAIFWS